MNENQIITLFNKFYNYAVISKAEKTVLLAMIDDAAAVLAASSARFDKEWFVLDCIRELDIGMT